jgi:gas vesicle protein
MAHIPYYGEDLRNTQESNKMVYNFNQLINHNLKMYDAFIDLKVEGWKSYSKALNQYTFNFFSDQLKNIDKSVETMASDTKEMYKPFRGVCK